MMLVNNCKHITVVECKGDDMSIKKKIVLPCLLLATLVLLVSCGKRSETKETSVEKDPVALVTSGQVFKSIIDSNKDTLLVFDLYADWCGPCKLLEPLFREMAVTHGNKVKFFRINVDKTPDVASAFGARGIPFVSFIRNGEPVHSLMGLNPREAYERVIGACGSVGSNEDCRKNLESSL
jgi:thioredoxin 1